MVEKKEITNVILLAQLNQKILDVAGDLGAMKKDGTNKFSGYDYITSESMLSGNRVHFPNRKLNIIPEINDYHEEYFTSEKGKAVIRTIVKMSFQIIDVETGYSITKMWVGADQDTGGKSFGQAVTESCKRFYFKLFNVSSNEVDPDSKTNEVSSKPHVKKETTQPKLSDTVTFGKHKDKTWEDVCRTDRRYVEWLRDKSGADHPEYFEILLSEYEKMMGITHGEPEPVKEQPSHFESPIDDDTLPFDDKVEK